MTHYEKLLAQMGARPETWLVTGGAGFIGSHIVETLLKAEQNVVVLDNLSTGSRRNLHEIHAAVTPAAWARLRFIQGTVENRDTCERACKGVKRVLHQAGFVSVPLSLKDPAACHGTNVTGFLNIATAARDAGVRRLVYASSSAVYGDDEVQPKQEPRIGSPLSPYGASKLMDELYAAVLARNFPAPTFTGLRYFNVFGPRQDPNGGYAAVIPRWIAALLNGQPCLIHGDGSITRDFCPVENVVQANLLAAMADETVGHDPRHSIYNVALGGRTTLLLLYHLIADATGKRAEPPVHLHERAGDILHSSADIHRIQQELHYEPVIGLEEALRSTVEWYRQHQNAPASQLWNAPLPARKRRVRSAA
jgi:UDP-N-acetylglucosamine 4-epimerase